jgi:hypothetical protein
MDFLSLKLEFIFEGIQGHTALFLDCLQLSRGSKERRSPQFVALRLLLDVFQAGLEFLDFLPERIILRKFDSYFHV